MGLAGFFLGDANPFAQWTQQNRNALLGMGAGFLSGNLGNVPMGAMEGREKDDAYATQQKAEATRAEQIKQAAAAARASGAEQLAQLLEAGMGPGEAVGFNAALQPKAPAPPISVSSGETLLDPQTYQPLYTGTPSATDTMAAEKEAFDRSHALWQEHAASNPVKTYHEVKNGYERVRASYQQAASVGEGGGAGAADISMIFAYMKMLDPTSVVREGEQATAANAGGIPATVQNIYNSLLKGDKLTPPVRTQFLQMAERLYKEAASNLNEQNALFQPRIESFGVDPNSILFSPEAFPPISSAKYPGVTIRPFFPGGR